MKLKVIVLKITFCMNLMFDFSVKNSFDGLVNCQNLEDSDSDDPTANLNESS